VWIQTYKGIELIIRVLVFDYKGLIYVWVQNYKGIELTIRVLRLKYNGIKCKSAHLTISLEI
jgi:hypothetical protein